MSSVEAPLLDARGLQKAYGARKILDDVSLTVHPGDRIGVVGRNGTGKSTLARILAGVETEDHGTLARRRDATFAYLEQDPDLDGSLSAKDTVLGGLEAWAKAKAELDALTLRLETEHSEDVLSAYELASHNLDRLGGWTVEHDALAMLAHLSLHDVDRKVGVMSGGEKRRVALARLLVAKPSLAILDEPTNHLDIDTIDWLEKYLAEQYEGGLLLVTHDRYFLNRVATKTMELDQGKVHVYDGGYEEYLEQKAVRMEQADRTERNRQNFLRRELEWVRRTPAARTGRQKARVTRADAALSQSAPPEEKSVQLQLNATRTGSTIIDVESLQVVVGKNRVLVEDLSFALCKGERVGIVGRNGAGKTTLLRALTGEAEPAGGKVTRGKNTKIAYLDQMRTGLDESRTVYENVAGADSKVAIADRQADIRSLLEKLLFDTHGQMQPVSSLSGGERARVLVAKMLMEPSNLMVLDEPTNDLDISTLSAIEEMLIEFDGTALIVTHDRWFLDRVATAILAFEENGSVIRYAGNYSSYKEQAAQRARALAEKPSSKAPSIAPRANVAAAKPQAKVKALSYVERLELDGILAKIETSEAEVKRLEVVLEDPTLYAERASEVAKIVADLDFARAALERTMARWEELEARA